MNTRYIKMLIPIVLVVLTLTWFCIRNANSFSHAPMSAENTWAELITGKLRRVELTVNREKIDVHREKTMEITSEIYALASK
jgi:hypothetical protein